MIPLWDHGECHLLLSQPQDLLYGVVRAQGVVNEVCLRVKHSNSDPHYRKAPIDHASWSSLEKAPVYDDLVGLS